jgi:hypothetical protein
MGSRRGAQGSWSSRGSLGLSDAENKGCRTLLSHGSDEGLKAEVEVEVPRVPRARRGLEGWWSRGSYDGSNDFSKPMGLQ